MSSVIPARGLAALLVTAMGVCPIVPPEHVHEAEEQGHHRVIIHRHTEPHRAVDHADRHHSVIDHDEQPLLTLIAVYLVPSFSSLESPSAVAAATVETIALARIERSVADFDTLIHSPPRGPTSLRAPPISPAS